MKVRHDVDATTIKPRRRTARTAIAGLALAAAVGVTATAAAESATHLGAIKTLHDGGGCCMRVVHTR